MKKFLLVVVLFNLNILIAQKDCEYNTNINDSIGSYKSTKDYLMNERIFGGSQKSIFFSLINSDGFPSLSVQVIHKSPDFMPAACFDENSRVFLQLKNGKIITLLSVNNYNCGNTVLIDNQNCRILTGYFAFMKDSMEEIKKSPISLMRIKYTSETIDYIPKDELQSEIDKSIYFPTNYFIDYLKCIE